MYTFPDRSFAAASSSDLVPASVPAKPEIMLSNSVFASALKCSAFFQAVEAKSFTACKSNFEAMRFCSAPSSNETLRFLRASTRALPAELSDLALLD